MHVDTPTTRCRAGVARADVTPPVGIYHRMWGAATHERATGVHRPLTATALVLHPPDSPIDALQIQVIVALDHCLLWAGEMRELLLRVSQQTGIDADQIVVAFSHTHAAGLMDLERKDLPGGELIAPYLENLAALIAECVRAARQALEPATISYAQGRCELAAQRDLWDEASGQFVCGFNPRGECDDTVLVGRITDSAGKIKATLVNYACHPTTLAWQNTLISPDFPGTMREVIEGATGAPCLFLQGASGDLGPREGFVGSTEVADRNGRQLGYAALAVLEGMAPPGTRFVYHGLVVSGATLGTWAHEMIAEWSARETQAWSWKRLTIDLPYRLDLPDLEQSRAEQDQWRKAEEVAQHSGDAAAARDAHAMIERIQRRLTRIRHLPTGSHFPLPIVLGLVGDAIWLFLEGELYQWFQTTLRARFPQRPIFVATLANGSRCSYLPTAETYGKGIYQESIAVLAQGSLERLLEEVARAVG